MTMSDNEKLLTRRTFLKRTLLPAASALLISMACVDNSSTPQKAPSTPTANPENKGAPSENKLTECGQKLYLDGRKPTDTKPSPLAPAAVFFDNPIKPLEGGTYITALEPNALQRRKDFTDASTFKAGLEIATVFSYIPEQSRLITAGGVRDLLSGRESLFSYSEIVDISRCNTNVIRWRQGIVTGVLWDDKTPPSLKIK